MILICRPNDFTSTRGGGKTLPLVCNFRDQYEERVDYLIFVNKSGNNMSRRPVRDCTVDRRRTGYHVSPIGGVTFSPETESR